jgi:hypothetical protein
MIELLTSGCIVPPRTARTRVNVAPQRSTLRLMWAIEPTTGKLAARWVVDASNPVGAVGLARAV